MGEPSYADEELGEHWRSWAFLVSPSGSAPTWDGTYAHLRFVDGLEPEEAMVARREALEARRVRC